MKFEKGHNKVGGRNKGTVNKSTEQARLLFMEVMSNQVSSGKINDALNEVYEESKLKYLYIVNKLLPYFVARKIDITSDGETLTGFKVEITKDADKNKAV